MCDVQQISASDRIKACMKLSIEPMKRTVLLPAVAFLTIAFGATFSRAADEAMSATVIGSNPFLTDGVEAMLAAHWQKGIELTERGLQMPLAATDKAAAYSNLCAAYVALGDYDRALMNCDESLKLDTGNWRAYNNRAGALLGKGRFDEALHDVQTGLALDPAATTLRKTETIVRDRLKRLYQPHRNPANAQQN